MRWRLAWRGGGGMMGSSRWMHVDNRAVPRLRCPSLRFAVLLLLLVAVPLIYFCVQRSVSFGENGIASSSLSPRYSLEEMREFAFKNSIATDYKPSYYTRWNYSFSRIIEDFENRFDISANDVLVFLHIQKTAGTSFERFLVKHLNISSPCVCHMGKKRCTCRRPGPTKGIWLFSRYSTGWVCGLHADFTELFVSGCVDNALDKKEGVHRKRRYFYTSFLREPISRFISEYRHVERGATWLAARHICNGRPPTPEQLPMCFDPEVGWDGVSLDDFLACPYNLAFNRQTRMLSDLTLVNCYDSKAMDVPTRERIMLESAKNNLRNLAFFGLKEYMRESQWMFEQLFQLKFTKNLADWTKSKSNDTEITRAQMELIKQKNNLDIQLYAFAKKLFLKRLKQLRSDESIPSSEVPANASRALSKESRESSAESVDRQRLLPKGESGAVERESRRKGGGQREDNAGDDDEAEWAALERELDNELRDGRMFTD